MRVRLFGSWVREKERVWDALPWGATLPDPTFHPKYWDEIQDRSRAFYDKETECIYLVNGTERTIARTLAHEDLHLVLHRIGENSANESPGARGDYHWPWEYRRRGGQP